MRVIGRLAGLLLVPTVGLALAVAIAPTRAELEVHIWLLVGLSLAFLAFMHLVTTTFPTGDSSFDASLVGQERHAQRPAAVGRVEREVLMAISSAYDLHRRFRPLVLSLARELLSSRRGIDLAREPDRARAVLGEDTWELVRPDRPAPAERSEPGIDAERLGRVVASLEAL